MKDQRRVPTATEEVKEVLGKDGLAAHLHAHQRHDVWQAAELLRFAARRKAHHEAQVLREMAVHARRELKNGEGGAPVSGAPGWTAHEMGDDSDDEEWVPYHYYYHAERAAAQFEHPVDGELHHVGVQVE